MPGGPGGEEDLGGPGRPKQLGGLWVPLPGGPGRHEGP